MPQCFVSSCTNYYGKTRGKIQVMYHTFPTKPELTTKWSVLCGYKKDFKPPPYARVCSDHFTPGCYQRDLQHELLGLPLRKKLKADAIPRKNLPNQTKNHKDCQVSKKQTDNVIKSPFRIVSDKKIKPSVGQMANKRNKTHLENMSNKNTAKCKVKPKKGLSKSHSLIKISINDLCRNKLSPQKRSDPLKESTVNKMERHLTKEVTIEPVRMSNGEVTKQSIKRLMQEVTIEPVFPKKEELILKQDTKNPSRLLSNSVDCFSIDTSSDENKTNGGGTTSEYEKLLKYDPWLKTRRERLPMRSSIRIAKKKSIESLSESFTMKVNSKKGDLECNKKERFSDKLKFMAMLQLRYMKNKLDDTSRGESNVVSLGAVTR